MEKIKKSLLAALLAVLFGLTALFGFAGTARPAYAAEEEPERIGVSFPGGDIFYVEIVNDLPHCLGKGFELFTSYVQSAEEQVYSIQTFIDQHCKVIVVAPIEPDALINILKEAKKAEIKIIVLGRPNINYPSETMYVLQSYYDLGWQHVESIQYDRSLKEVQNFHILYYPNQNGEDYLSGVKDALSQYGCSEEKINCWVTYNASSAKETMTIWLAAHDEPLFDEVLTYEAYFAQNALEAFYDYGYLDAGIGIGTGIRALEKQTTPTPMIILNNDEEDYNVAEEFANLIAQIIAASLLGTDMPESDYSFNGGGVYKIGFAPGRAQYVEK